MKVRITYKDPDGPYLSLKDAVSDFPEDERRDKLEELKDLLYEVLGSDEYITIELDTETKTASIKKRS